MNAMAKDAPITPATRYPYAARVTVRINMLIRQVYTHKEATWTKN